MVKFGTLFWLTLVATLGFAMFRVKYEVQGLDNHIARVVKQTQAERQDIHVLKAEWAYLNQPDRLAALNQRFLQLGPILPRQLDRRIADIPFRAPAIPDIAGSGVAVASRGERALPVRPIPTIGASMSRAVLADETRGVPIRPALMQAPQPQTLNRLFAQIAEQRP